MDSSSHADKPCMINGSGLDDQLKSSPTTQTQHQDGVLDKVVVDSDDHNGSNNDGPITKLNDYALLAIFYRLPLRRLFYLDGVGMVCCRWRSMVRSALCQRRSLVLLVGKNPASLLGDPDLSPTLDHMRGPGNRTIFSLRPHSLEWSKLRFRDLTCPIVINLVNSLTNVHSLEIAINDVSVQVLSFVCFLLTAWSNTLSTLKISADFKENMLGNYDQVMMDDYTSYQLLRLLNVINTRLPLLRNFTFHVWKHILPQHFPTRLIYPTVIDLPILSQLEYVYFYSLDHAHVLLSSVAQYAVTNGALKHFGMPNPISDERTLNAFFDLTRQYPHFSAVADFIGVYFPELRQSRLDRFVATFRHLTSLWLYVDPAKFSTIVTSLAPLTNLTYLQFSMHYPNYRTAMILMRGFLLDGEEFEWENAQVELPGTNPDVNPDRRFCSGGKAVQESPVTLPSVKALYIRVRTQSHTDLASLPIRTHFPCIEVLELDNPVSACLACQYSGLIGFTAQQRHACLLALAMPFVGHYIGVQPPIENNLVLCKYI